MHTAFDGYKIYGLSSYGNEKEISGLLVTQGDQPVCFQSSVLGADRRRDVNSFIKEGDTWTKCHYRTLGSSGDDTDRINDDGVPSDQTVAIILRKALGHDVASLDWLHTWRSGDEQYPSFFGSTSLTIFKEASEVPDSCIKVGSCSGLGGFISHP